MEWQNVTLTLGRTPGVLTSFLKGVGAMFYVHNVEQTTFSTPEEVPKYFRNAWPYFLMFMILENAILWLQKKPTARLNDSITSVSHGIFQECGRLITRGSEAAAYLYLYDNFRLVELDWQSPITWYLAVLGVDFCYYWVHRANHEVTLLWAQHQVHHSSDEFNLAVGLRQSILQGWCSFVFYLPLALFIPPSHFLVHQQFNLMYQFWIHTKVVESLGPLEYILNTPKHHRVHHGCNIYCIDCNYGGLLIIWDRIFGTFVEEKPKENIVYGLVFAQPSFNPFFLQIFYNGNVINKWRAMEGWYNKLSGMIKGPSWTPGSPWKGRFEDRIEIVERERYDVVLPTWCNWYLGIHFIAVLWGFHELVQQHLRNARRSVINNKLLFISTANVLTPLTVFACVTFILFSLTTIGMLFDKREHSGLLEAARCLLMLTIGHGFPLTTSYITLRVIQAFFAGSAFIWLLVSYSSLPKIKNA